MEDQHRMFVQAMMWKKICSTEEVVTLYKKCNERNNVSFIFREEDLKVFVEKINSAIRPMNMMIKKGIDELTGEQYYVLVNESDNSISRLSSEYKPNELELFKKIVSFIVESEDGKVVTTIIYNSCDEAEPRIAKREAEEIITRFSESGWLIEDRGYVYFTTRAIVELQHFLKENFSEAITMCIWCKNIVFQGEVCNSCDGKIHKHCKTSYFKEIKRSICPHCNEEWR